MKKLLETLNKWWFYFRIFPNPLNSWNTMGLEYNEQYDKFIIKVLDYNNWKFETDDYKFTVKLKNPRYPDKYLEFWIENYPYCFFYLYTDKKNVRIKALLRGIYNVRPSKYTIYRIHKALEAQKLEEGWFEKRLEFLNNL